MSRPGKATIPNNPIRIILLILINNIKLDISLSTFASCKPGWIGA